MHPKCSPIWQDSPLARDTRNQFISVVQLRRIAHGPVHHFDFSVRGSANTFPRFQLIFILSRSIAKHPVYKAIPVTRFKYVHTSYRDFRIFFILIAAVRVNKFGNPVRIVSLCLP